MRILMTGGSGVLGRAVAPALTEAGHVVRAPGHRDLDLFDPDQVADALPGVDAVLHLATRIPPRDRAGDPAAWAENDRLRGVATGVLVDAALAAGAATFVLPTITFVYPQGPADELTPLGEVPARLRSALEAEAHVARFRSAGRHGVVLRLGFLYGPGTGNDGPGSSPYPSTLYVGDAARALALALTAPAGLYNIADDGPVSHDRFTAATGWRPAANPVPHPRQDGAA